MSRRQGKRAWKLMEHPKFRAAFDLLELRAEIEATRNCSVWPVVGRIPGLRAARAKRYADRAG
jgi:hypothetical protein